MSQGRPSRADGSHQGLSDDGAARTRRQRAARTDGGTGMIHRIASAAASRQTRSAAGVEQIPGRSRARAAGATAAGIVAFAAATALAAQPEVRLPFTPIPLTLQALTVLLAGYWLGPRAAFASQSLYL